MTKNSAAKSRPAQGRRLTRKRPSMPARGPAGLKRSYHPPASPALCLPGRESSADKPSGGGDTPTHEGDTRVRRPAGVAARLTRANDERGAMDALMKLFGYKRIEN